MLANYLLPVTLAGIELSLRVVQLELDTTERLIKSTETRMRKGIPQGNNEVLGRLDTDEKALKSVQEMLDKYLRIDTLEDPVETGDAKL